MKIDRKEQLELLLLEVQIHPDYTLVLLRTFEQMLMGPANGERLCSVVDKLLRNRERAQLECVQCCDLNVFQAHGSHSINTC